MLLVVTYSAAAQTGLRNLCRRHESVVARRFGRAALFDETVYAAFLALRLRESHGGDVQIERTEPFNEFVAVDDPVREAAAAYADRSAESTPYAAFAAGTEHPDPDAMRDREL
ncbi:hypothetical protein C465_09180 [Halorubrum distributum JCM 9100]|uniref:Uncharacterized protein n=2 Tax=Halorubrum distributum TaxID=29283 RepID=M0EQN2_9EURY|nr:hypothetical protein [Halorubrum distributum]ELZ48744.1 hypothetical protein C465_09180 [Halorubrum distributum JCM 9100]ELZ51858.1 hypothetical protein C466_13070 [Halorubrum distributum JCM 10118]